MSHELRTPMHSILSFAALGLKKTDDQKIIRYLENIRTSGIRLTDLLNDLLDLSKLESGKTEVKFLDQDLTIIIQQAITELSSLLQKKFITVNFEPEINYNCIIDQKMMTQVIINILSNAIKFSPDYGVIDIKIAQSNILFNSVQQDVIQLSVSDQGIGIPPDEIESVFDKFIQSSKTKTQKGGTGLGLSICKEIIKAHQGMIWAESPAHDQESGSTFHIKIPVLQGLSKFNDIPDIDQVIEAHLKWKVRVDNKLEGNSGDAMSHSDAELNHHLCTLGKWIDSKNYVDTDFLHLKFIHKEFHLLAAELIGYSDMNETDNITETYEKFRSYSEEIVSLLKGMNHEREK